MHAKLYQKVNMKGKKNPIAKSLSQFKPKTIKLKTIYNRKKIRKGSGKMDPFIVCIT